MNDGTMIYKISTAAIVSFAVTLALMIGSVSCFFLEPWYQVGCILGVGMVFTLGITLGLVFSRWICEYFVAQGPGRPKQAPPVPNQYSSPTLIMKRHAYDPAGNPGSHAPTTARLSRIE